jgi:hypothetical protein
MKKVPLQRRTPLRAKGPVRRARQSQKRKRPTGFTDETKARVRRRSANQCEIPGCPRKGEHFHHRKLRRFGDHSHENCLHVCGVHHTWIHANPEASYTLGYLVQSWRSPVEVPVLPGAD